MKTERGALLHFATLIRRCGVYLVEVNGMASNPMRLTDEANEVALRYGPTVSKGILEMAWEIEKLEKQLRKRLKEKGGE